MLTKNLQQYSLYLKSFPRFSARDVLKLERIQLLLKKLGHPEKTFQGIQVAGTNGKGSTVAFLESIYKQAGYKVGSFYSPHLVSITERIRINGRNISQKRFVEIVELLKPLVDQVEQEIKDRLTWFELITAAAVVYFFQENVNIVIFEVGLGGKRDATSALGLKTKIITNIGYDHTRLLGNSILKITREKMGIIQKGDLVVTSAKGKALSMIKSCARSLKCHLSVVGGDINYCIRKVSLKGTWFDLVSPQNNFKNLKLSLIGKHQARNFACALGVVEFLCEKGFPVSRESIFTAAAATYHAGRFQILAKNPLVILDGAHNISGIKSLINTLKDLRLNPRSTVFIFGALKRKKRIPKILRELADYSPEIIFPNLCLLGEFYRPEVLKYWQPCAITTVSLEKALSKAKKLIGSRGIIVICGSLYLVGEMLRLKSKSKREPIDLLDDNITESVQLKEKAKVK